MSSAHCLLAHQCNTSTFYCVRTDRQNPPPPLS